MRQTVRVSGERHLFQIAADLLNQMTELEKLRDAVQLAETAKALHQSEARRRRRINRKVTDPFAGSQLRA
jgi:hypothetical protein